MQYTDTLIPTEFQIDIMELGWIENVYLIVNIDGNEKKFLCKHQWRYSVQLKKANIIKKGEREIKKVKREKIFYSVFKCIVTFEHPSENAQYLFSYYVNGQQKFTKPISFYISDFG